MNTIVTATAAESGLSTSLIQRMWPLEFHSPFETKKLADLILTAIAASTDGKFDFKPDEEVKVQFGHSDCYVIAEHLLYALHDLEGVKVSYIYFTKAVPVHAAVQIEIGNNTFYVDIYGVTDSISGLLSRYNLKESDVSVNMYTSVQIIEEGNNEQINKLTRQTRLHDFCFSLAEKLDLESAEYTMELGVHNVLLDTLSKSLKL